MRKLQDIGTNNTCNYLQHILSLDSLEKISVLFMKNTTPPPIFCNFCTNKSCMLIFCRM